MIPAISSTGPLSSIENWLLFEWTLLKWQFHRDEFAVKTLMERLHKLGYELILMLPTNHTMNMDELESQVRRIIPSEQNLPILVHEQTEPKIKFKVEVKEQDGFLQVTAWAAQVNANNIVLCMQKLLRESSKARFNLTLFFRSYEHAYWFKSAFFRSFYFSQDEEMLDVLERVIQHTGGEPYQGVLEYKPKEKKAVPPDYSLKMLDVSKMDKQPLDATQQDGVYQSQWMLKDPETNKQYEAKSRIVIINKAVDPQACREDMKLTSLTGWLYQLTGIVSGESRLCQLPINPNVPLHGLLKLKPGVQAEYKIIEHAAREVKTPSCMPYRSCDEYTPNIGECSILKTGRLTVDGVSYLVQELGRLLAIAYVFDDDEFFDNLDDRLQFQLQKNVAIAIKKPTALDFQRTTERTQKMQQPDVSRKLGTEKCSIDLLEMCTNMKESFYIGISCLRSAYLSDVFSHPAVVELYKDNALMYNRLIETRLRFISVYLKEFFDHMGTPTFPLDVSDFDLKPNLFIESTPFPYENLAKLKERVILVHAQEDEMLDQVLSEAGRIFDGTGIAPELLECRNKTDEQLKEELEKHRSAFVAGERIVLVRNFHRIAEQYKMNLLFECGMAKLAGARLLITCPSHYLLSNYQSWFRPQPNSPEDLVEIRVGGVVKEEMARMVAHYVEEPHKYLDLIYADSCLVDLISSPSFFNRFYKLVSSIKLDERLYGGYQLFRRMLDNWMLELKSRGLYAELERQLLDILRDLSLNYVIRGRRVARLPSRDLWELLYRSNHIGLVRLQEHNGVSFIRNKFSYFYVADFVMKEVWKEDTVFNEMPALMRFPLLRKIFKEELKQDDRQRLLQKIMNSKHDIYFGKPTTASGIAISLLHACDYDLSNRDLSLTELKDAGLHGCNLSNTKLRGANLSGADLTRTYCFNTQADLSRLVKKCKVSEVEFIGTKIVITDILVAREGRLLVNSNGLVEQVEWGELEPLVNYNLPTAGSKLRMICINQAGFLVAVRDADFIEVYDLESGNKLREFNTNITYIEYLQLIHSYAVLGRRSVDLEIWDYYKSVKVRHIVWKAIVSSIVVFGSRNILIGDERGVVSSVVIPDNYIEFNFKAHDSEIHSLHAEEQRIITAAEDRTIKIWRLAMGQIILFREIKSVETIKGLVGSHVNDLFVVLGTNSATLLSKSLESYGRFYKPGTSVHSACIDQKLNRLYLCTNQGISMLEYLHLHDQQPGHSCSVTVCLIDDYFNRLITGALDSNILVWDMLTYRIAKKLEGHTEGITCLALVGYEVVVSGSNDFTIRLWNIPQERCLMVVTDHQTKIQDLAFNYKTKVMFSGSADGEVKVWKLNKLENSLKWMKTFQQHRKSVLKIACDTASNLYVSSSEDYKVIVYGEDVKYCQTLLKSVVTAIFMLEQSRCLCYCQNGLIVVINMTKGNVLSESKFESGLSLFAYLPQQKLFVSVRKNCIVVHSQDKVLQVVTAHPEAVNYLAYNPYTNTIVTVSSDCCLGIWSHDLNDHSIKLKRIVPGESLTHSIVQI